MKTRTDIINYLAVKHNLRSYLEIGTQHKPNNFDKVLCPTKICVDPDPAAGADYCMTSDKFFYHWNPAHKIDLVFVDGLHHADQVQKDLYNSLSILSPGGFIVLHDMLPVEEIHAKVPRESKVWNGDTFRVAFQLLTDTQLDFCIVDIDQGCGVVSAKRYDQRRTEIPPVDPGFNWRYYQQFRSHLPVVTPEEFQEMM